MTAPFQTITLEREKVEEIREALCWHRRATNDAIGRIKRAHPEEHSMHCFANDLSEESKEYKARELVEFLSQELKGGEDG